MLISHKNKFITIDIPKTGSRSLRESFLPLGIIDIVGEPNLSADFYQHGTAKQCQDTLKKKGLDFKDYFSFTIVRNPWYRYFSFFKYFKTYADKYKVLDKSITWNTPEIRQGKYCLNLFKDKDHKTILKNIINNTLPQSEYYSHNNKIIVDHIAEFENLQNEFFFLCEKAEIEPPNLHHGNKSGRELSVSEVYDENLINLVFKKEKGVIKLKDYKFPSQ